MTEQEQLAEEAAKLAVKKTFSILGVNIDDPKQVEEFRRDLRWAGDWRRNQGKGVTALFIGFIMSAGGFFWMGLRSKMGGP